jgi:serine O-acetyltransferase
LNSRSARAVQATGSDALWARIRREAEDVVAREPEFGGLVRASVLGCATLVEAVGERIAARLDHPMVGGDLIRHAFGEFFAADEAAAPVLEADLAAILDRDPAATRVLDALLYFKGFHAIQTQRLGHWLWRDGRRDFALYLQSRSADVFQVDIHPAVPMGRGLFVDHATGVVIGETATIGDEVSILQNVTLGGTGRQGGDRHPKIRRGVLIGAGATLLGAIEIGAGARIGAGSVVLNDVPPHVTVAGNPARVLGDAGSIRPALAMDQMVYDVGL